MFTVESTYNTSKTVMEIISENFPLCLIDIQTILNQTPFTLGSTTTSLNSRIIIVSYPDQQTRDTMISSIDTSFLNHYSMSFTQALETKGFVETTRVL